MSMDDVQAVVVESKVYIGGNVYPGSLSRLLVYDISKKLWDILDTPTYLYALTTYHSQLVLVGGINPDGRATSQLWVLDEQHKWIQPLPPMTTKRYQASAVSVGVHLIVAGGCSDGGDALDEVVIYDGHQWRKV